MNSSLLRFGQKLRIACIFILVTMVLSRLTWLQIRIMHESPHSGSYLASTLTQVSCENFSRYDHQKNILDQNIIGAPFSAILTRWATCHQMIKPQANTVHVNRWFLILTVLILVLMTRAVTSSWMASLLVGAVILSRGAFLARIALPTPHLLMSFLSTVWFGSTIHFFRTASFTSLWVGFVAVLLGTSLDSSFAFLGFAFPLFLLIIRRQKRGYRRVSFTDQANGHLLRPLSVPFLVWVQQQNLFRYLLCLGLVPLAVSLILLSVGKSALILSTTQSSGFWTLFSEIFRINLDSSFFIWLKVVLTPIDFHYVVSLFCIGLGTNLSLANSRINLSESSLILVIGILLLMVGSWGNTFLQNTLVFSECLTWFEPNIIAFAVVVAYHLFRSNTVKSFSSLEDYSRTP